VPDNIKMYFPGLSELQKEQFSKLEEIYRIWNSKINVISRKDIDNFFIHHLIHSLSVAKIINFRHSTTILDAGTGGGFPGIPLAIMFPECSFTLIDSIGKKISVVSAVALEIGLSNVIPVKRRIENESGKYDFIVSRAVTSFPSFVELTSKNVAKNSLNDLQNGILYLKGGDLTGELGRYKKMARIWNISGFFDHPFFETKKIIHLPL